MLILNGKEMQVKLVNIKNVIKTAPTISMAMVV